GFDLRISASNQLFLTVQDTGGADTFTGPTLTDDVVYAVGISGSVAGYAEGAANKIQMYVAQYTNRSLGAFTKTTPTGSLTLSSTGASSGELWIGDRSGISTGAALRGLWKQAMIFNRPLVESEYGEWADMALMSGSAIGSGGGNRRIGLG